MGHNRKIVGFIGIDKYEYILYLSRLLYQLNKKLLLIDYSATGALTACIPTPTELSNKRIEYRGIMFQRGGMNTFKEDNRAVNSALIVNASLEEGQDNGFEDFDCILIDCGDDPRTLDDLPFDILILVTDQQMHNLDKLAAIKVDKAVRKILVIKNYIHHKIGPSYIMGQLNMSSNELLKTYIICQDEVDERSKLSCQTDSVTMFTRLSAQSKILIKGLATILYPEMTRSVLEKAYKKARRGL